MAPATIKRDIKARQIVQTPQRVSSRTLYSTEITTIPRWEVATGVMPPNVRRGASVKLIGWKFMWTVENKLPLDTGVFNWAIIQPIGAKEVSTDGFFRTWNSSRDVNFSLGEESGVFQYNPISTDKYLVLRHGRKFLSAFNASGWGNASCRYHHDEYIKFNGMIRYNDDVGTEAENPIFFVYWFDYDATVPTGPIVTDCLEWEWKAILFFDDEL